MNLSIQDELQLFAEELYQYFTPSFLVLVQKSEMI
ncbi:IS231-related, transposase [Bacillus thuringiensis Sbt003]|uniref:Transposase for insertion sequence element IS231E n=3 Tax=Bacillus cereus group TaxID=86661 RepID=A0A9W5NZ96_BACCE|nr:IS231-related, transposase [Bacillus thuringiensis YBT-1518]EJR60523.1 transposase for insertion sequence element IS231E [Bacillus cereus VD154]KIU72972.1 IS231-related, transposase [Bacillus thuringiensis Sbt003]